MNASADEPESNQEAKLNEYSDEVNKLWEKLMYLEVVIVDQIEVRPKKFFFFFFSQINWKNHIWKEITRDFERNMSELVTNFVEQIQSLFSQIRDLENIQFERLQELCLTTLEKVVKGEIPDDFSDDLRDVTFFEELIILNDLIWWWQ